MIKVNIVNIIILIIFIILIILIKHLLCRSRCRCKIDSFKVGGQIGEFFEELGDTISHEYRTHVTNRGGIVQATTSGAGEVASDLSEGASHVGVGLGMAADRIEDGAIVDGLTGVGMALTDTERNVLNQFDNNCQAGTQANRQVCQLLDDIGFDTLIEKGGFIANMKRISDNAHDIIVNINIINDAKSAAQCTEIFETAEAILVAAITAITGPLSIGMDFLVVTIGVGIVAACAAIELSDIPNEEKENITYSLAGWVQYRLGPLITGSENDIYIPDPENNYMTDIIDSDVRKFVQFDPRFITENQEEADIMCENSINLCSEFTRHLSNAQKAKKVFDKVKTIYDDRYPTPTPARTKKKYMLATLAAALTFAILEEAIDPLIYNAEKCTATQQLLFCGDDHVFAPGEDYRHLAEEYENTKCNLYSKREDLAEDISCCAKDWNTNVSTVDTHVDENGITRSIFIKNDGTKCVAPSHYINVQNHSNPSIKRFWNSSKNTYYTNRPQ